MEKPPPMDGIAWWPLLRYLATHRNPLPALHAQQERLGDIRQLRAGPLDVLVMSSSRCAQHMLAANAANYVKAEGLNTPLRALTRNTSAVARQTEWPATRRALILCLRHITASTLQGHIAEAWAMLEPVLAGSIRRNDPLDFTWLASCLAINTAVQTFGLRAPSLAETQTYGGALQVLLHANQRSAVQTLLPAWLPCPGMGRRQRARLELDAVLGGWLNDQTGGFAPDSLAGRLSQAVSARADTSSSDAAVFQEEMLAILLAGHETVAAALTWCICLLLRSPQVLMEVCAESKAGRSGHADLPLTTAVVRESLRLFPPAWRITRRAAAADEIDGRRVAAGQSMLLLLPSLHRHPAYWQAADSFQPERFLAGAPAYQSWAWLPFGAGSRRCIGAELSMVLLPLLLASLLQRYAVVPTAPLAAHPPEAKVDLAVTLRPHNPVMVYLRPAMS